jgi:predicted RNase H-like HicB family nuclease
LAGWVNYYFLPRYSIFLQNKKTPQNIATLSTSSWLQWGISGEYDVRIPDLPGGITCGKDLADAIEMAEDAISMWLCDAEDNQESIPAPSEKLTVSHPQFIDPCP